MGTSVGRSAAARRGRAAELSDPDWKPWPGFALAAQAAAEHLNAHVGMDLWLVTHVQGEEQLVIASAGPWQHLAQPGSLFAWSASFCLPMTQGRGPLVAACVEDVPAYETLTVGPLAGVRAYLGIPLVATDGTLFGTLCAFAGTDQPRSLDRSLASVELVGRMLSTILAREQDAHDRSQEAARAYAYADRDALTGLRNRRGWQASLAQENDRCSRYGGALSVMAVDLDHLKRVSERDGHGSGDELIIRCGTVLNGTSRPGDAVARVGGDEFAILAVQCDARAAQALTLRLRVLLRSAGLQASLGAATRRPGEDVAATWGRADEAMYRDKRRHRQLSSLPTPHQPI